ncbi:MAG: TSUP family transporter [Eubacteriales bacterium]
MSVWLFAGAAVCGALSAMGVGGGTLLLLWLTSFWEVPQLAAQSLNLLYFLPAALAGVFFHWKNGYMVWKVWGLCVVGGCAGAALGAALAAASEGEWLRKAFYWLLIALGIWQMFCTKNEQDE